MTRTAKQTIIDENGQKLLRQRLDSSFFAVQMFGDNDKTPDIDGHIRFRDGSGENSNEFVHFQLKSTEKANSKTHYLTEPEVEFLCGTNLAVLLFVSNIADKVVYWHLLDRDAARNRRGKGLTIQLSQPIEEEDLAYLQSHWRQCAKVPDLRTSSEKLREIAVAHVQIVKKIVGLIHLLMRGRQKNFSGLAASLFSISKARVELVLNELEEKEIITRTSNYILLNDLKLGSELSRTLFDDESLENLFFSLSSIEDRILLIRSLSQHKPTRSKLLTSIASRLAETAHRSKRNTEKYYAAESIRELSESIPNETIPLLRAFVSRVGAKELQRERRRRFRTDFKSVRDVVVNASEGLSRLLLVDPTVLKELWGLLTYEDRKLREELTRIFKELVSFDAEVMRSVGLAPQRTVLKFLTELPKGTCLENLEIVCSVCSELLDPSYEAKKLIAWDTLQFGRGALPPSEELEEIRNGVVTFLSSLLTDTSNLDARARIIVALQEATVPSPFGVTSEKHRQMIVATADRVLAFYNDQLPSMPIREIYFVEEQVSEIERYFGSVQLPTLKVLKANIAKNSEYKLIKALIGWGYLPTGALQQAHEERISAMLANISEETLEKWAARLSDLASDRALISSKGYVQLTEFVRRIGKEKPRIAKTLLNIPKLNPLYPSILKGLEEAGEITFIKKFIRANLTRHLEAICEFLRMSSTIFTREYAVAGKVAIKLCNRNALQNILDALAFKKVNGAREVALAVRLMRELAKQGDRLWIHSASRPDYLHEVQFTDRQKKEIEQLLITAPSLDYCEVRLLAYFGKIDSSIVASTLEKRIRRRAKLDRDDKYDAVPFRLNGLEQFLLTDSFDTVLQLAPLVGSNDVRCAYEANDIFRKCLMAEQAAFEQAIERQFQDGSRKSLNIAARLLRYIRSEDRYVEIARKLLSSSLCSKKVVDEVAYHIANFDREPQGIRNWEASGSSLLKTCSEAIKQYREERIAWQKAREEESQRSSGIDEHTELRKRGIYIRLP